VDASQWVARTPHVAGSLTSSFIRTTNPGIMEQEREEEEACRPSPLRNTFSLDEEAGEPRPQQQRCMRSCTQCC
jgi:hypothetical protein